MPCYHPLDAVRIFDGSISFNRNHKNIKEFLTLPCGQCIGCRLERSRQWAIRCLHESSLYSDNCFITLTYSPENLPIDMSLNLDHFQKFMKRLRFGYSGTTAIIDPDTGEITYPIRFYHCGEYGTRFGRLHYHACLFNFDFPDKKVYTIRDDTPLYTSEILSKLWPYGFSSIGAVTFESAAYVARYIMKKINGDAAAEHYTYHCPISGNSYARKPEYTTMSRRPGIGSGWFDKHGKYTYDHDHVIVRGLPMRPPKYYDGKFEVLDPMGFEALKFDRSENAKIYLDDQTPDRLKVKEQVKMLAVKHLPRNLD